MPVNDKSLDRIHIYLPTAARDQLLHFRSTHPVKYFTIGGTRWEYIACGRGTETLLILPGGFGIGEASFQHILALEDVYRIIALTYPSTITTMAQMVEGIVAILAAENVSQAHVLGSSYGGMVAQRLVREYPEKVGKLILSHTGGPKAERAERSKKFVRVLRWLPMGVLRALLRLVTRKALADAPAQRAFWQTYSNGTIARLCRADLISRYQLAADFDATTKFTSDDLKDWPGRILILEGDNDPIAEARARQALKALYPQAEVHTFHGTGHSAPIARVEEYVSVIEGFLRQNGTHA